MIKYFSTSNPVHKLSPAFQQAIKSAQESAFHLAFPSAGDFVTAVRNDLLISPAAKVPAELFEVNAATFADKSFAQFNDFFVGFLMRASVPVQSVRDMAATLSNRAMLLRAFANPDAVVDYIGTKVVQVIHTFPQNARHLEVGRNKGDVLDPFILAATQDLLYDGKFDGAVSAAVSHKAIMIIEGLLGHLHEDVLGHMRGNVRVPEPRGEDQEKFDLLINPFPGSDLIQPPLRDGERLRIHQIKSKTGSAKGGDGKRLGDQLKFLAGYYDADIFYDALVGNTLEGHRSKAGVQRAAPSVRVLVGQAAFLQLTGSQHGASLMLKLYQEAFKLAAAKTGYSISKITESIVAHFLEQAEAHGEDHLSAILEVSTGGPISSQDSLYFDARERSRKPRASKGNS